MRGEAAIDHNINKGSTAFKLISALRNFGPAFCYMHASCYVPLAMQSEVNAASTLHVAFRVHETSLPRTEPDAPSLTHVPRARSEKWGGRGPLPSRF